MSSTTGWPTSYPFVVAIDFGASNEELVKVTNNVANTLTIERAFGGTSAVSHSTGAAVRHVFNAVDATDFRTHEQATAAVHGVTGTLVGTTDTQTLTNKTLTSPTINAGALSGTFTGAHTYSGAVTLSGGGTLSGTFAGTPTFSGIVTHTAAIQSTQSAAGNTSLATIVTADTFDRFRVLGDGKLEWGPGNAARDVQLYRGAADVLETTDTVRVYGSGTTADAIQTRVTGDTVSRLNIDADGTHSWGPGGAAAQDTNLYRSAADTLKTDDSLVVVGDLSANNIFTGPVDTYTPTWTSDGGVTSIGNGTLAGYFYKVGRLVHFWVKLTWGSTTSSTGTQWHFTVPTAVGQADNTLFVVHAWAFDSSTSNRYIAQAYVNDTDGDVQAIARDGTSTFWDQGDPFTYATGDRLNLVGFYEAAT